MKVSQDLMGDNNAAFAKLGLGVLRRVMRQWKLAGDCQLPDCPVAHTQSVVAFSSFDVSGAKKAVYIWNLNRQLASNQPIPTSLIKQILNR